MKKFIVEGSIIMLAGATDVVIGWRDRNLQAFLLGLMFISSGLERLAKGMKM